MRKHKFKPNKHEVNCFSNGTRAEHAETTMTRWQWATGTSEDPSNVTDLIADLGHMCDRDGLDFEAAVNSAMMNWRAER